LLQGFSESEGGFLKKLRKYGTILRSICRAARTDIVDFVAQLKTDKTLKQPSR